MIIKMYEELPKLLIHFFETFNAFCMLKLMYLKIIFELAQF